MGICLGILVYAWALSGGNQEAYLGIGLVTTEQDAKQDFVFVYTVMPGSAAAKAGVKPNDRLLKLDGERILNLGDVDRIMEAFNPGQTIALEVLRRKKTLAFEIRLMNMPPLTERLTPILGETFAGAFSMGYYWFGFESMDVRGQLAKKLQLPKGILVTEVFTEGPAKEAGLEAGDVVIEVAGKPVATQKEFADRLSTFKERSLVALLVVRDEVELELSFQLISIGDVPDAYRHDLLNYFELNGLIKGAIDFGKNFDFDPDQ